MSAEWLAFMRLVLALGEEVNKLFSAILANKGCYFESPAISVAVNYETLIL